MNASAVRAALVEADHLAHCARMLLGALNAHAVALDRIDEATTINAVQCAKHEADAACESVSEYWRGVNNAVYEYRKRADRVRQSDFSTAQGEQTP